MIVAVAGGKGGVGKSTVALNLAATLDGVVVDADLGMADLPGTDGPDLHDVLAGRVDPDAAVTTRAGTSILPCGRSLAGARAADPSALVVVLERLEARHGWVVVDVPAGLRADVGLPLFAASVVVLVTIPDPTAVADALRVRALASELDVGLARLVVNRTTPTTDVAAHADCFGVPATGMPESTTVAESRARGVPIASLDTSCPAQKAIESVAESVQSCRRL